MKHAGIVLGLMAAPLLGTCGSGGKSTDAVPAAPTAAPRSRWPAYLFAGEGGEAAGQTGEPPAPHSPLESVTLLNTGSEDASHLTSES
jgi:hypothetical protein